jgi:biofilm PGA synthesis N-glycosyltransferase PgaC
MEFMHESRYVVISPVRDEAQYLETTICSMLEQTVRPAQWILVDDGSTDGTADIVRRYAAMHPWITPVHNLNRVQEARGSSRGTRAREAKEIEAFYTGCEKLAVADWEYLVKIDGDVGFEPDYFERCFDEFEADSHLGIGGGLICNVVDGEMRPEPTPRFHVRGAAKIYKRACWEAIGGVVRGPGWDTLDEVKANMLGWRTHTFPHLKVAHYRFTGAANGTWKNFVKNGVWSYAAGYHPLFMAARCINQSVRAPYVLGSIGLMFGYLDGYLRCMPKVPDKNLVRYLRQQQLRRLSFRSNIWQ